MRAACGAQVVDTTGAGDCFTGAYAVAMLAGKGAQDCLQFAGERRACFALAHLMAARGLKMYPVHGDVCGRLSTEHSVLQPLRARCACRRQEPCRACPTGTKS